MRKFWSLLLTLTMVMQLVALPMAGAEEVTTPTDLKLPCEACGGYAVLGWTKDSNGTHIKMCPHGVIDEESRHAPAFASYESNQTEHWSSCSTCGQKDLQVHTVKCTNVGVCVVCQRTDLLSCSVNHNYDSRNFQFDNERCWIPCKDCDDKSLVRTHVENCMNRGVCVYCGQSGVTFSSMAHRNDHVYKYDNLHHWWYCPDCGAQVAKNYHVGDCSQPGVCRVCGQSGVELSYINHEYDSEHYDYDQYSHWYTCTVCGSKEWRSSHNAYCLEPDVCCECGQTDVIIDNVWHIQSPSGSVTWEYDSKEHWITCVCGEEDAREEHYNLCTDLTTCVECGVTGVEFASTIHDWDKTDVEYDNEKCWQICRACNEKFGETHHAAQCATPNVCFYCDQVGVTISELWHNLIPNMYEFDAQKHWQKCSDCGVMVEREHWALTDDPTKCVECGYPMPVETATPTIAPTEKPIQAPTASPIPLPTEQVTATPTAKPTEQVTATPTAKPTEQVTTEPTAKPTEQVTTEPTVEPTEQPTAKPTKKPAPVPTEAPAHEHTFDIAFVSNNDGTHSKTCLGNCGEVQTESCHLVTTDMGMMTCTACATCGYAVYTAKEGVAALTEGENVPAKVVRIETAAIAPAAEDAPEAVPADTQLLVHETTFDVPVALSTELKGTVEKVFTATLVKDGETIQPTGKVKLTIPVEEETLAALEGKVLMLMREDGTLIELAYEIIDGEIVFLTDELGVFLLMTPEAK